MQIGWLWTIDNFNNRLQIYLFLSLFLDIGAMIVLFSYFIKPRSGLEIERGGNVYIVYELDFVVIVVLRTLYIFTIFAEIVTLLDNSARQYWASVALGEWSTCIP